MRFRNAVCNARRVEMFALIAAICATTALVSRFALADEPSALSMEKIFASGEFSERGVDAVWAPVGAAFIKRVPSQSLEKGVDVVLETPDGEQQIIVSASELVPDADPSKRPLRIDSYELSEDSNLLLVYTNSKRVWRRNTRGDYWIRDRKNDVLRKLGGDFAPSSSLQFAKISPDGTRVGYVCENNLYVEEIASGKILQLTKDGSKDIVNGTFDWVYEEEFDCRDGFRWSPDGKKIAFWRVDSSPEPEFAMLDNTGLSTVTGASRINVSQLNGDFQVGASDATDGVNDAEKTAEAENAKLSSYPTLVYFKYPRVGFPNANVKIGVASLPELGQEEFDAESNIKFVDFNDPEEHYLPSMEWLGGAIGLIVQKTPRSQRRCDVFSVNPDDLTPTLLFSESDPDGAWQTVYPIYPLSDGKRFLRVSEADGWRRYYLTAIDDCGSMIPITLENADAIDFVAFDYDENGVENGVFYYASPENACQRFLYRADFAGKNSRVLVHETDGAADLSFGFETWSLSADSHWGICRRSAFGVPSRVDLVRIEADVATVVKCLQDNANLRRRLDELQFGASEFFKLDVPEACDFESGDDHEQSSTVSIDGWVMTPPDWDPESDKKYPTLVYVYGEPAAQTVVDSWGGSTYLYHRAIANLGCVVISFDGRGTPAPKGRAWRKKIYQKFGAVGRSDQAAALRKFLETNPIARKLDLDRIGVWGWSGGGTSTLNLMFNYPELYKCGVAIAPVADYRNYDTIYQERYSGLITETPESYELGSAINYAEKLQGALLIIHGTGDDNCHYQSTEQLINKLISNGKEFEAFAYPFRSHGIFEGVGTTLHLRKKTMRFWEQNLLSPVVSQ